MPVYTQRFVVLREKLIRVSQVMFTHVTEHKRLLKANHGETQGLQKFVSCCQQ